MKNKTLKIVGASLILLGLLIFFLKPLSGITGFTIAENISSMGGIWLYVLGLGMLIAGFVLSLSDLTAYTQRDSRLKEMLGDRYEQLSDAEKITLNKSYRRHIIREEKERDRVKKEVIIEPTIIRTRYFNKAIRGHEAEVEAAIEKLKAGKGKKERLTHIDGFSIRTRKGGRIVYDEDNPRKYVLKDYTQDHSYKD